MTQAQLFGCWTLPVIGKKQELFDNGLERTMWSTWGARVGRVNETEIRRLTGFELMVPELGIRSNHFSTPSLDTGSRKFCRESEVVPIVFDAPTTGNLEVECDASSNKSSPVGSHWKEATCFTPDWDKIVSFRLTLKKASGCDLLNKTKRLPLWPSGKFLTATISRRTWQWYGEHYRKIFNDWKLAIILIQVAYAHSLMPITYKRYTVSTKLYFWPAKRFCILLI